MKKTTKILIIIVYVAFISCSKTIQKNECNHIKVSFPEEICLAKEGDLLLVEKVGDSIYIGFKN